MMRLGNMMFPHNDLNPGFDLVTVKIWGFNLKFD